jgi:hypothetical protein
VTNGGIDDDRGPQPADATQFMVEINFVWIAHVIEAWLGKEENHGLDSRSGE